MNLVERLKQRRGWLGDGMSYKNTFSPVLAGRIGLNPAIMVSQILAVCERGKLDFRDKNGHKWFPATIEQLRSIWFPWMSSDAIGKRLKKLEAQGIIIIKNHPTKRCRQYRIDYDSDILQECWGDSPQREGVFLTIRFTEGAANFLQEAYEKFGHESIPSFIRGLVQEQRLAVEQLFLDKLKEAERENQRNNGVIPIKDRRAQHDY